MTRRQTITTRIASTRPVSAYGGIQLAPFVLQQIAEAVRTGAVPMVVNHDRMKDLHARCVRAEVVDLEDGFQAVEADFEVDADVWDEFQQELETAGAPGGMSFSASQQIDELPARDPDATAQLALFADAGYFSDADLVEAARELTDVAAARVGRLYQFSAAQSCRIVIEHVQEGGGLDATKVGIEIGIALASSAIYDCIKYLLSRRKVGPDLGADPAQIEIHTTSSPDGVTTQTFQIRTNDAEVVKRALDHVVDAAARPGRPVVEWDEDASEWREP